MSVSRPTVPTDNTARPTRMPMIATTTITSSSVKPPPERREGRLLERPVADIGIDAFTALLAVGPERVHVELAVLAGALVVVRIVPRVARQARQVLLPVRRDGLAGMRHERLQALERRRIAEVVEPVQVQRRLDRANVLLRAIDLRGVDLTDQLRRDDRGQEADDHHDDHDLDQREAALAPSDCIS